MISSIPTRSRIVCTKPESRVHPSVCHLVDRMLHGLVFIVLCSLLTTAGCLMAGSYHSARLLEPGTAAVGATFSTTSYSFDNNNGDVDEVTSHSLMPEVTFHVAANEKLEFGGRVGIAQLAMEGDLKYRFLRTDRVHLALGVALGIKKRPELSGLVLRLPLLATVELTPDIALVGSMFAYSSHYSLTDDVLNGRAYDWRVFDGSWLTVGASAAIEISLGQFAIQPGVERARYSLRLSDEPRDPLSTTTVFVHMKFMYER